MIAEVALPLPLSHTFTYKIPLQLEGQVEAGHSVLVPFRNRPLRGIVTRVSDEGRNGQSGPLKEIGAILNRDLKVSDRFLELTSWVAETYGASWGEALKVLSPSLKQLKRPGKKAPFSLAEGAPSQGWPKEKSAPIILTGEQAKAVESVRAGLSKKEFKAFLLFGVTSSGKTEIYLRAIHQALEILRRQALFLVPEISLCRPFYKILKERYGSRVGIWHSQVSMRERNEIVEGIRKGSMDVVLGARSALFAPLENLGVIILDEEHDFSYKQDEKPRYHAREVALKLAQLHRAAVILGSATPSLESFHKAQTGEYELLTLSQRPPSQIVPEVTLLDRRKPPANFHQQKPASLSSLEPLLIEAVNTALSRREQVILALNRRGFSTFVLCRSCGRVWKCPNCLITLVHHKDFDRNPPEDILSCHFCFHKESVPAACAVCKSGFLMLGGYGTQKVVQEVKKQFPYARVLRLDRDTARKKSSAGQVVQAFSGESADILVGTQMVTQGFDFPRVTLVGILDADTALHHPDFRSAEKTFQWICQASGRAGRSSMGGKVLVQTMMPDHYALREAAFGNYEKFYEQELEFRRALRYPPFSSLILLRIQSSLKKDLVVSESERLHGFFKGAPDLSRIEILGPGPSARENLMKQARWQILLKCPDQALVRAAVKKARDFAPKAGVRIVIDVDPYDVL